MSEKRTVFDLWLEIHQYDPAFIVRAVNAHEGLLSLLQRIQTHIAVGCKPERGYGTAHTELAIEIDAALSAAKE